MNGLIGKKIGMTQIFTEDGVKIPVTVVQLNPNDIVQVKNQKNDGYWAVQLAYGDCREKVLNKPNLGHLKKASVEPKKYLREFVVDEKDAVNFEPGKNIKLTEIFSEGDFVDAIGTSKGRGFAGVIKRHNFHGAKSSHGVHEFYRHGGSIGQHTYPGRVFKNKKMPGHYGNARITTQTLKLVKILEEDNLVFIKGSVPGHNNNYVIIQKAVKKN
ncbi:MAG: 50S ribosomal protein L3 [Pseudomonadota bacterium]